MKIKYEDTVIEISFLSFIWRVLVFIPCILYLLFIELPLILISIVFNYLSLMAVYREYYSDTSFGQLVNDYLEAISGICDWYTTHIIDKICK